MRVLILDMVHGGDLLAIRHLSEGDDVTCVDVYGICPEARKEELRSMEIRVTDKVPEGSYDMTVMPTHCTRAFLGGADPGRIVSFSQDVCRFIEDRRFRIEVTGVKGKTSTCYLIAKMLSDSGKKVLLHTSRGEGPYTAEGHMIDRKVSIAPPYIMTLEAGDYDAVVCEVSLGGSGKADIACITNLVEDYGIAKNTLKASDAKKDILTDGGINIVSESEEGFWSAYGKKLTTYGRRVTRLSEPKLGEGLRVDVDYDGTGEVVLDGSYVSTEYLEAMDLALEVCHRMGIPRESVVRSLETFRGVPGRGEILKEDGRTVIRERNPGISHLSIGRTLKCLKEMDALGSAMIILDPVSKKVCDKMDTDEIRKVVDSYGVPMVVTKGDGVRPDVPSDVGLLLDFVKEGYQ